MWLDSSARGLLRRDSDRSPGPGSEASVKMLRTATPWLLVFLALGCEKGAETRSPEEELKELAIKFFTASTFDKWASCLDEESTKMFNRAAWEKSPRPALKREDFRIARVEVSGDAAIIHCEPTESQKPVMRRLWAAKKNGKWLLTFGKASTPLHKSHLEGARERARKARCRSHLKQIGLAIQIFVADNEGRLPPNLELLFPKYIDDTTISSCPSKHGGVKRGEMDYAYVAGLKPADPKDCVLAYDKEGNHEGGRNVLLISAEVKWMTEAEFRKTLAKTMKHKKTRE